MHECKLVSECASVHNLRGHRGCALASVGPATDKVPVNGKCCVVFKFTQEGLPSLLWFFDNILCGVLFVVNNFTHTHTQTPVMREGVYTLLLTALLVQVCTRHDRAR